MANFIHRVEGAEAANSFQRTTTHTDVETFPSRGISWPRGNFYMRHISYVPAGAKSPSPSEIHDDIFVLYRANQVEGINLNE